MDIGRRGRHRTQRQDLGRPDCSSCCRIVPCPRLESPVTGVFLLLVNSDTVDSITVKVDLLLRAPIVCFNCRAWASKWGSFQARHLVCCKGMAFIYNLRHR